MVHPRLFVNACKLQVGDSTPDRVDEAEEPHQEQEEAVQKGTANEIAADEAEVEVPADQTLEPPVALPQSSRTSLADFSVMQLVASGKPLAGWVYSAFHTPLLLSKNPF